MSNTCQIEGDYLRRIASNLIFWVMLSTVFWASGLTGAPLAQSSSSWREEDGSVLRLGPALMLAAQRNKFSDELVEGFTRAFSPMIDFTTLVESEDAVELVADQSGDRLMFASLSRRGSVKNLYRFTTSDGHEGFYDSFGGSADRQLLPKPILNGTFQAGFALRRHPILEYEKFHTGVDWAAGLGEPVYATGSGIIERAGWEDVLGNAVQIRHSDILETSYTHLSAVTLGLQMGTEITRGQIIGYVGSTGLSTGPHLHYEVHLEGHPVDPMKVDSPPMRVLEGLEMSRFEKQKERLDAHRASGIGQIKLAY